MRLHISDCILCVNAHYTQVHGERYISWAVQGKQSTFEANVLLAPITGKRWRQAGRDSAWHIGCSDVKGSAAITAHLNGSVSLLVSQKGV